MTDEERICDDELMHGDETPTYGFAEWVARLVAALPWRPAPQRDGLPFDKLVDRHRADTNIQPWRGEETPTDPVTVRGPTIPEALHKNVFRTDLKETLGLDREIVLGYDVSAHQGLVDHASFRDAGYVIGIAKATEGGMSLSGKGYVDKRFAENWRALEREGLVRTCYHFARVSEKSNDGKRGFERDGENEALWLLEHYGKVKPGMLPPVLDIEWDKRATAAGVRAEDVEAFCVAFVNMIHIKLGIWPIVYTGPNFWKFRLKRSMRLTSCPLWIVTGYRNTFEPAKKHQIPGWDWFLHQHTNKAKRPDVPSRNVDANYFRGTLADLRAMAGIAEVAVAAGSPEVA